MKIHYIYKYLLLGVIGILMASCSNTDAEQKFDKTPTERLNAQQKELNDLLLSSENGWKAVYFTDNTVLGGYTHLFKFASDGTVEMASDFDEDTAIYKSEYNIQLGSTVSLVFTTKNRIHLLSDSNNYPIPALRAKGYLGDFQFLYYGQENDEIIFKTNRNNHELRFIKATSEDWKDLSKNIDMIDNVVGADSRPLFRLLETNDGSTIHQFDFTFAEATRFAEANSIESGYSQTYNIGVGYSPTGIVISPALEVGNQKLTTFIYNDLDGSFTATGENNVTATIKYSDKPLILTDDYKVVLPGQPTTRFGYYSADYTETATTNSPLFKQELAKANSQLPEGITIASIQLYFNFDSMGNFIYYTFKGSSYTFIRYVDVTEDSINKTVKLSNKVGSVPTPSFLKGLDDYFLDPNGIYVKKENFKLYYSNDVYTFMSSSDGFRMTTWKLL